MGSVGSSRGQLLLAGKYLLIIATWYLVGSSKGPMYAYMFFKKSFFIIIPNFGRRFLNVSEMFPLTTQTRTARICLKMDNFNVRDLVCGWVGLGLIVNFLDSGRRNSSITYSFRLCISDLLPVSTLCGLLVSFVYCLLSQNTFCFICFSCFRFLVILGRQACLLCSRIRYVII